MKLITLKDCKLANELKYVTYPIVLQNNIFCFSRYKIKFKTITTYYL